MSYEDEPSSKREDLPDRIPLRLAFPWTRATLFVYGEIVGQLSDWINQRTTWWLYRRSTLRSLRSPRMLTDNPQTLHSPRYRLSVSFIALFIPSINPHPRALDIFPTRLRVSNISYMLIKASFRDSTNRPTHRSFVTFPPAGLQARLTRSTRVRVSHVTS